MNKKQNRFESRLTDEDKRTIATTIFEAKKNNPEMSWVEAIAIGRAAVPEERTFSKTVNHPSILPWLQRALTNLEQEHGITLHQSKKRNLNAEQQQQFAKVFYDIRKSNPYLTINDVIRRSNQAVPENCRVNEKINSFNQLKWLSSLFKTLAEADSRETTPKVIEPQPVIRETPPIIEPVPSVTESHPEQPIASAPIHETLESVLINAIVGAIKPVLFNIIQSPSFATALRDAFADLPAPANMPIPVAETIRNPVDIRKKVMIIGLIGQQGQEIRSEFGKLYDLRIFDSEVTTDKIRSNLPSCDKAIIMTKFISHRVQDAVRGLNGFTYCNGGVTALKELLVNHGH